MRARPGPDPFEVFVDYVTARLTEDPHLWVRTLLDELEPLGFGLSYQSLTRNIRARNLRPDCQVCRTATDRPNAVIPHPPGDETQWDWLELPDPPDFWGWGKTAHLLVGSLAHSGKWRAALSQTEDQPHLVAAVDRVTRGLGGLTHVWRFDRMATVCDPPDTRHDMPTPASGGTTAIDPTRPTMSRPTRSPGPYQSPASRTTDSAQPPATTSATTLQQPHSTLSVRPTH